jgi:hypothetical protein
LFAAGERGQGIDLPNQGALVQPLPFDGRKSMAFTKQNC